MMEQNETSLFTFESCPKRHNKTTKILLSEVQQASNVFDMSSSTVYVLKTIVDIVI